MENLEIRHYEKITEDLVDLFKILNIDMNENSPLRVKFGEDCFHDLHNMTDSFVAYVDEKPVGCAILQQHCREVGIITNIYVAPEYRKHGLCFKFFDVVEEQARKRGHIILIGDTWNEYIPMQKAFLKGGFIEYDLVPQNDCEREDFEAGHNYWKLLV